ncbi:MAG: hypothetical protein ACI81I_000458 [Arcobacteraceae bacterium]|jgi:hypothetical protein
MSEKEELLEAQKIRVAKLIEKNKLEEQIEKIKINKCNAAGFLLYQKKQVKEIYKKDFKESWYHKLIAEVFVSVLQQKEKRVIISLPPRYFKTEQTVRQGVSYAHGVKPNLKFQYVTYGAELSETTGGETKEYFQTETYKKVFPKFKFAKLEDKKTKWRIQNQAGGFLGTSIGGAITGMGAHIAIIDDPLKADDADSASERKKVISFFKSSVLTRLEDDGAIIVIMQRLHEEDLVGYLLKEHGEKKDGGLWTVINLEVLNKEEITYTYGDFSYTRKANEPLNEKIHTLEQIKQLEKEMGKSEFKKQYMQDPEEKEAGHFNKEDITTITDIELPEQNLYIHVDTAESKNEKADDRAIGVVGWSINDESIETQVVMDGKRGKWDVYETCTHIIALMTKFPDVPVHIEGAGGGITLEVVLKKEIQKENTKRREQGKFPLNNGINIYAPNNKISKNNKIKYMTVPIEQHTFKVHIGCDTDFKIQFIKEAAAFNPEKTHNTDNCIDTVASTWLFAVPKKTIIKVQKQQSRRSKINRGGKWRNT